MKNSLKKTLKHYIVGVLYLFSIIILTSIIWFGIYVIYPHTLTSEIGILMPVSLALIMIIDFILLVKNKLTPALVLGLVIVSPILMLYTLICDDQLIPINRKKLPMLLKQPLGL
jgi:hypothetical protein